MSYEELDRRSAELTAELKACGAGVNEPVIAFVSNRAIDWVSVLAIWRAHAVLIPVHRSSPAASFQDLLERTGARLVIDASGSFDVLGSGNVPSGVRIHAVSAAAPAPRPILDGAAFVIFTSGSTGRPKGAVISHQAFCGKLRTLAEILRFTPDTRSLVVLQMTFIFGIWVSLLTMLSGGTLVMREKFDALRILRTLASGRVTTAAMVPTMLRAVFSSPDAEIVRALDQVASTGTLVHMILGGEALDALVDHRLRERFREIQLFDVYGTTETASSDFILSPGDQTLLRGTLGRVSPGVQYRVVHTDGRDVAVDESGELILKSTFVMSGYLDEPELTRQSFLQGHFKTGDIVRVRKDGALEIVGRSKEIISRGGNKISPIQVELALLSHPAVSEAIVTGVPDPIMGERIHALIVPIDGATPSLLELRAWASERLEKFKVPDVIHFGSEIPRGRTGKADRGQFRRNLLESPSAQTERKK